MSKVSDIVSERFSVFSRLTGLVQTRCLNRAGGKHARGRNEAGIRHGLAAGVAGAAGRRGGDCFGRRGAARARSRGAREAEKWDLPAKALTAHEYATLQKLSDLILPADDHSPGALEAGAAGFLDFLCSVNSDLRYLYTGGLMWLDEAMEHGSGKPFLEAAPVEQTAMLDKIAYRKNASPEFDPGIEFFALCRRMVADAYYTTPIGYKEVGYMGNSGMAQFSVPKEALEYALKRSGLG